MIYGLVSGVAALPIMMVMVTMNMVFAHSNVLNGGYGNW